MKILIFNWQDIKNPLAGGAEVHLHEIFSRVAKLGHEVTLYCSMFEGATKEETINGINVIREGGRFFFNFYVPLRYFSRFKKEKFDVVIDDMNKIPFYTPWFVREPLAVIIHHLFSKTIFLEAPFPLALYVYLTERVGVDLLRKRRIPVFAVSPSTINELTSHGISEKQLETVYNCVDHSRYVRNDSKKSSKPLIGYFGRIKKYKSVDHLLKAFAIVLHKFPEAELVVVGEGDNRPELEKLTYSLNISNKVKFTGFVSEEEKVRLMQEVWYVVNPSSKEGWGLTVIEANACGTPVIASNVPGLRDAVRENETGLFYEYGNIEMLAEKMLRMLNDSELRQRLSNEAYTWSMNFNWEAVAQKTVELLQRTISNHKAA